MSSLCVLRSLDCLSCLVCCLLFTVFNMSRKEKTSAKLMLSMMIKLCRVCVKKLKNSKHLCVFEIDRNVCNACAKYDNECSSINVLLFATSCIDKINSTSFTIAIEKLRLVAFIVVVLFFDVFETRKKWKKRCADLRKKINVYNKRKRKNIELEQIDITLVQIFKSLENIENVLCEFISLSRKVI